MTRIKYTHGQCITNVFFTVPIGFIYVQLPNQPEPRTLWPTVGWSEVSSQYAGLFFRVAGGGAASFGSIQTENSPRLTSVNNAAFFGWYSGSITVHANGEPSARISSGSTSTNNHWGLTFTVTSGEVRPRNQATRIWRRT